MILQSENINKSFRSKQVLKDVSFSVKKGTITGIVGENGSGKTTLLKILVGLLKPDKGNVNINGEFGYCPQEALVFPHLTVRENLRYFSAAYGIIISNKNSKGSGRWEGLLNHFQFKQYMDKRVNQLSGGTIQKLNLSIALIHNPDLLILDEPYAGFDWETYERFWDFTLKYKEDGKSILMVTHLISEKSHFDNIYQIKNGQLE